MTIFHSMCQSGAIMHRWLTSEIANKTVSCEQVERTYKVAPNAPEHTKTPPMS